MYDTGGRLRKRVKSDIALEAVVNYQGRLLAKGRGNSFFFLNEDLTLSMPFQVSGFGSLYSGWVANGEEIVAYGSIPVTAPGQGDREFELGFMRIGLRNRLALMIFPTRDNDFYRINHQYIAPANGGACFLVFSSKAAIYCLGKGLSPIQLKTMPVAYSQMPSLIAGASAARQRFEQIESLRMPAGLYGDGSYVYLLERDPEACSPWSIYKIDPVSDRLVGSISLPSLARHLALVPGGEHWLLIEEGAVMSAGLQRIDGFQAVPASWITDPETSPLKIRSRLNNCLGGY